MFKYVYVELRDGVLVKPVAAYEQGESREKMFSFNSSTAVPYDTSGGYDITREGDTLTLAKGGHVVDVPWSQVKFANRAAAAKGGGK